MKPLEKDRLIYNPPAWSVCNVSHPQSIDWDCPKCNGTCRVPIRYTPEQWQEAGGVLSDDTPAWFRDVAGGFWHLDTLLGAFNKNDTWGDGVYIIITIPGQDRPPADWRPENKGGAA